MGLWSVLSVGVPSVAVLCQSGFRKTLLPPRSGRVRPGCHLHLGRGVSGGCFVPPVWSPHRHLHLSHFLVCIKQVEVHGASHQKPEATFSVVSGPRSRVVL